MNAPTTTGSTRTIWTMAVVAVIALAAGLGLSRLIVSPADAAANAAPPDAGPITVPVERRALANDVVLRADAIYEDPVDVTVETGDLGGPAIVTGGVPAVGTTVEAGQVLLEVTGRPVILLTGELPVYRTLRAGVSGPDVLQLKTALDALGIDPGDAGSDVYDAATAAAVVALYERVGYPAPSVGEEATATVDAARSVVRDAERQVTEARRGVDHPDGGTPRSARIEAQGQVDIAAITLRERREHCAAPPTPDDPLCRDSEIKALEVALASATAARDEANAPPDTSAARAFLADAQQALTEARTALAEAQQATLTPLPAGEVVYLATTPRRVDAVGVRRGSSIGGSSVLSVSGATLQLAGSVSPTDAELITEGSPAVVTLPDGQEVAATVQSVGADSSAAGAGGEGGGDEGQSSSRRRVVIVPDGLTEEQRAQLQGANVRVTVPVGSTDGEVMAVPLAALTAGPGGQARVEVLDDDGTSTLVTVGTGLAAGGFVEVSPLEGALEVGDRVVVGVTSGSGANDDAEEEDREDGGQGTGDDTDGPDSQEAGSGEDTSADAG